MANALRVRISWVLKIRRPHAMPRHKPRWEKPQPAIDPGQQPRAFPAVGIRPSLNSLLLFPIVPYGVNYGVASGA
ncbi:hypothetical protein FOPE_09183 [Fonsecaea pedrosoi]|nr:hypothetical protein FOPE_09183 [Fonsecaea pedrosoi]